jgi:predicted RNase H-like HicB family nuclease
MTLTAVIYPDTATDLLVAECPEIGTASQGYSEEEAIANLLEAATLYLESFPEVDQLVAQPGSAPENTTSRGVEFHVRSFKGHRVLTPTISGEELADELFGGS